MKKKIANVAKYVQNAAMLAIVNAGTRRKRRSRIGCAAQLSRQKKARAAAAPTPNRAISSGAV